MTVDFLKVANKKQNKNFTSENYEPKSIMYFYINEHYIFLKEDTRSFLFCFNVYCKLISFYLHCLSTCI